jgi:hypothetical protein
MKQSRHSKPDIQTYTILLIECAKAKEPDYLQAIYSDFQKDTTVQPDFMFYTSIINACIDARMFKLAHLVSCDLMASSIPLNLKFGYTFVLLNML